MNREVKLSVFFCGTNGTIEKGFTQISLFFEKCRGTILKDGVDLDPNETEYKMGFDGCANTNGSFWGGIFGYGLSEQCEQIAYQIARLKESGKQVSIVGLGLSRGAIALLMLTKLLQTKFPKVKLDLVLFDPVPGNSIYQAKLDFFGFTNTSLSGNLSECSNLRRVLVLYPYEPLPDLVLHAPLIPVFFEKTRVEYDVIPGCHQGAFLDPNLNHESYIAYRIVREKLEEYGMPLELDAIVDGHDAELWEYLENCSKELAKTTRATHSFYNALIVRETKGTYLNKYHEKVSKSMGYERELDKDFPYQCFIWTKD